MCFHIFPCRESAFILKFSVVLGVKGIGDFSQSLFSLSSEMQNSKVYVNLRYYLIFVVISLAVGYSFENVYSPINKYSFLSITALLVSVKVICIDPITLEYQSYLSNEYSIQSLHTALQVSYTSSGLEVAKLIYLK